ncbi:MAG: hypothetical protein ACT4PY_05855 [Armatimonadota bacterium]
MEAAVRISRREARRVFWECMALAFLAAPIYGWSWHLTDPRLIQVAHAAAAFVNFGLPFFRWLVFHVRRSDAFG